MVYDTEVVVSSLKIGILNGFVENWETGSKVILVGIGVDWEVVKIIDNVGGVCERLRKGSSTTC